MRVSAKVPWAVALTVAVALGLATSASFAAMAGEVRGPHFKIWDLKFGLIGREDADWVEQAIENGTLKNREPSCKVVRETTTLAYPLPTQLDFFGKPERVANFGVTFEYTTTKPKVPYKLEVAYPPLPSQGRGESSFATSGYLPGKSTGKTGRFCFSQFSNEPDAQINGMHCYKITVEGIPLPEICADVINPSVQ